MNTYKQEFNVANWSEIETELYALGEKNPKGNPFEDNNHIKNTFKKLVHIGAFPRNFRKDYDAVIDFTIENKIDFINFDK